MKKYLLLFVSLLILSCKSGDIPQQIKEDGKITLKFVQLNDVYEIAPLSGGKYGGMARVTHVVDSLRNENPNTYLFMAGDFLNPSLLGTVKHKGERIKGRQMIEVMNAMQFSLVAFGNHEFDLDREDLQKRLNESNFQWISTNVREVTENGNAAFKVGRDIGNIAIPETVNLMAKDADGTEVRMGFFSVCLDSNPRDYVYYGDVFSEAENAYKKLQNTSDIIIGLTHVEVEQDMEMAKKYSEIKLIMGGHEHNNMLIPVGNTVVAKADANAKTVYIHTLEWDRNTGVTTVDSELFPIDQKIASSPKVKDVVDRWNVILEEKIREVVSNPYEILYKADIPLDGTDSASRGVQTNLGGIITSAMAESFSEPVDAALVNGGSIRIDDMLAGDVTSMDIFRVLPFGGHVVRVDMTEELLVEVLDYGKSKGGTGAYLQRYNIEETADGGWKLGDRKLEGGKVYHTVALSDFLLKGYDIPFLTAEHPGILSVHEPTEDEAASDIRKAVIKYLQRNFNQ